MPTDFTCVYLDLNDGRCVNQLSQRYRRPCLYDLPSCATSYSEITRRCSVARIVSTSRVFSETKVAWICRSCVDGRCVNVSASLFRSQCPVGVVMAHSVPEAYRWLEKSFSESASKLCSHLNLVVQSQL